MSKMRTPAESGRVAERFRLAEQVETTPPARENQDSILADLIVAQADVGTDRVLRRFGVPPEVSAFCGLAPVQSHGAFFEFSQDGLPAIIVPVMDDGEVADLSLSTTTPFSGTAGCLPNFGNRQSRIVL